MTCLRNYIFGILCCFLPFLAAGQAHADLELLKKEIRQATLYDSSAVFSKGAKAIYLAKKYGSFYDEGLIYQYYGNFYYYSSNYPQARKYYAKAIQIARDHKDVQLENATRVRMAFMLTEVDEIAGENEFKRLLKEAKAANLIENQIEIYNGLGILYEGRMMDDQAVSYYLKGLKLAEKHKKDYFTSFLLNNLGLLKYENQQFHSAREDLERGLVLAKQQQEWRLVGNLLNNLGLVDRELKDYASSVKLYKETVKLTKRLGFPFGISAAYINLGDAYKLNGQFKEAMACEDSAISLLKSFDNLEYLQVAYMAKALIAVDMKNAGKATMFADSAAYFLKKQPVASNQIDLINVRSKIAELKGDYRLAYELNEDFHAQKDSLNNITNQDKLAELQAVYGKERMENALAEEQNKNKLLAQQKELDEANWRLLFLILAGGFVTVLGVLYIRNVNNLRKQQKAFSQGLIQQVDAERSRISKDLHDDIGQLLSVIKSKVNMFQTGRLANLEGLENEIGEVINHTRTISHELHPSSLEKLGLKTSLNSLLEKTQVATDLVCSSEISDEWKSFSMMAQTQLFRIFQECVSNTIKYAHASALKIVIAKTEDGFLVEYRDNGIGFDPDLKSLGLGWLTIRERVHQMGGKMELNTAKGKGVHLIIKLKKS